MYAKKTSLISQVNKLLWTFRDVNCSTKTRLVKSYSTHFYGAEIWGLSHNGIKILCIAWRKQEYQANIAAVQHYSLSTQSDYAKRCLWLLCFACIWRFEATILDFSTSDLIAQYSCRFNALENVQAHAHIVTEENKVKIEKELFFDHMTQQMNVQFSGNDKRTLYIPRLRLASLNMAFKWVCKLKYFQNELFQIYFRLKDAVFKLQLT